MRIISKTFQARALSTPVVVVNLLEFKQKPLSSGPKSLENGWELSLGSAFDINVDTKKVVLPMDQEISQHIFMVKTTKEAQKALFKEVQQVFKLAKKVK